MGGIQLYCEFFFFCAFLCVIRCVFCTAVLSFHVRHLSAPTPHKRETAKRAACTAKRTSPPHAKMLLQNREREKKENGTGASTMIHFFVPNLRLSRPAPWGGRDPPRRRGREPWKVEQAEAGGGGIGQKQRSGCEERSDGSFLFLGFLAFVTFSSFFFFLGVTKKNERAEINRKQTSKQANQKAGGPRACGW